MSQVLKDINNEENNHPPVNSAIYRSWQRSSEYHVAHERVAKNEFLPSSLLQERKQFHSDLVNAGKFVLPYVFNLLHGSNYLVLLTDNEGFILDTLGDPPFMSKAQRVCLAPGANWREEIKGTNAIGTALTEKAPTQVLGWEHFVQENHFMACWAAPIRNSSGEIIGILDISGEVGNQNQRLLNLAVIGAHMLEQNLQIQELQRKFGFYRQGIQAAGELIQKGLVTIDGHGMITEINRLGAQLLNRKPEEVIGHHASEVFLSPKVWILPKRSSTVQLKQPVDPSIVSVLHPVVDTGGNSIGAVGVLESRPEYSPEKNSWVGRSVVTKEAFARAAKAAATNSTVLILGESGTGKEVMARYIHERSPRHSGPFIALNCAALPQSLVESELFGYVDGAFTGARKGGHPGKFEQADGGTIFLDEIGDMPLEIQVSLLRVLQEREVLRIGSSVPRKIDVRVISATHKDLQVLVSEGKFRLDLFYRLKVINIELPPLRARIEDIKDLVPLFIAKYCETIGKPPLLIAEEVYQHLSAHTWPGNIRELENCIESMVAMAEGPLLTTADLPDELKREKQAQPAANNSLLDNQTRQAIVFALNQTNKRIAPAARLLGISRNTLYRKIKEFGIELRD